MEYLYFDHYPFTATENVRASYFSDVETIRKVAYENGRMKTGGFTQMGWWNGMRGPNVDEARWSDDEHGLRWRIPHRQRSSGCGGSS